MSSAIRTGMNQSACEAALTEPKQIETPLSDGVVTALRAGDQVHLSGTVFTARDAAHQRFARALEAGEPLPFDPQGQVIYYVGPTPAPPGKVIGSAGPTTSARMDPFLRPLLARGLKGTIGKGDRSPEAVRAMSEYGAVYFVAVGGAGALLARHIRSCEVIAYPELGAEAVRKLIFREFPLIVAVDAHGGNLFESGPAAYRKESRV
jgi:fumarate hydratase subunit beta